MPTTTDHGLLCLDETEYGAIALAMQADALATEAALVADVAALNTYFLRPSIIVVSTSAQNGIPQNVLITLTPTWSLVYSNIAGGIAGGFGVSFAAPRTGWYQFGGWMPAVASGGVTAGSDRYMQVAVKKTASGSGPTTQQALTQYRTFETNTGGEALAADAGFFYATAGDQLYTEIDFSHTNTGSAINVAAGARQWVTFMGSGDVIKAT